jgi:hypothetical protein
MDRKSLILLHHLLGEFEKYLAHEGRLYGNWSDPRIAEVQVVEQMIERIVKHKEPDV